ncbi:1168_t:CDS:2, partial [Acaulospora colombiana]
LDELKYLSKSVNPKWLQSGIALLAIPVTDLFNNGILSLPNQLLLHIYGLLEVESREEAWNSMGARLKQLKEFDHRDEYITIVYSNLVSAGQAHEACQEEASSEKAVEELKKWYKQDSSTSDPSLASTEDLERFLLPLAGGSNTHVYLPFLKDYQSENTVKTLFEPHQQYSENAKEFVRQYCNINWSVSLFCFQFSSSKFIAENHEQYLLEATHRFMKPTEYVDFATGGKSSTIIFGTDLVSPAIKVAISLMSKRHMNRLPTKAKSLQLERRLKPQSTFKKALKPFSD